MSLGSGLLGSVPIGSSPLSGGGGLVAEYEGDLVTFSAIVAPIYDDNLITFQSIVSTQVLYDGDLITFQAVTYSGYEGDLVRFGALVEVAAERDFIDRTGWDTYLSIDGVPVPRNQITGTHNVGREQGEAAQAYFELFPPRGPIDLDYYEGKSIVCDIATYADGIQRIYTGRITSVELDLMARRLKLKCTDDRRSQINNTMAAIMPSIGYWSENVFGAPEDLAAELEFRLQTVPFTVNFDRYGTPKIAPYFSADLADFEFTEDNCRRDSGMDPIVTIQPRAKIENTVKITYDYNYSRMFHAERSWNWEAPYNNSECDFLMNGYSVAQRSVIEAAIQAAGWPLKGQVTYIPVLKAGWYTCGGFPVGWATASTQTINVPLTTTHIENAVPGAEIPVPVLVTEPVLDDAGQPIYQIATVSAQDLAADLCFGASWQASYQWAQNITEQQIITVSAPNEVAKFTAIISEESASVDSTFDTASWENYPTHRNAPQGITTIPPQPSVNYYWNETNGLGTYSQDIKVLLNKAKTKLLSNYRDNHIIFNTFISPQVDLHQTIQVDFESPYGHIIRGKGRVYSIVHTFSPGNHGEANKCNTKIDIQLFRSSDSGTTPTALTLPPRPTEAVTVSGPGFNLDSHYGLPVQPEWTGHIGNKATRELLSYTVDGQQAVNYTRTKFPEMFVVDTPAIPEANRTNKTLPAESSYAVQIPNDYLEIEVGQ